MIHENAHILSFASSQADNDTPDTWTEVIKKGSTCAPNYYHLPGCMNDNSYLNLFFQEFYVDIHPSYKYIHEFDDYDKFQAQFPLVRHMWVTEYVTGYATTNPVEDFAESFTAFVLYKMPTEIKIIGGGYKTVLADKKANSPLIDQKIRFFYDFPELVEMRDFIRSNL